MADNLWVIAAVLIGIPVFLCSLAALIMLIAMFPWYALAFLLIAIVVFIVKVR